MVEEEIGAGVPDLPRPAVTGGLKALKNNNSESKDSVNDFICRICLDSDETD